MPVAQVSDGMELEPNHVYVIPPNRRLVLSDHEIATVEFDEPRGRRLPIDHFFRSMADRRGDGVAIVLTGSGSDGAVGIKAVKEAGGVILAQDPLEAEYSSMPGSAIATGIADFVLPVSGIASRLVELLRSKELVRSPDAGLDDEQTVGRKQAELHQQSLINELNHRVKNTLTTVQAIAAQTFRCSTTAPNLLEGFEARLIALSNAHTILTQSNWEGADIRDVVARAVQPHAGSERIRVHGPSIRLSPKAALAIAMGMHELATNAVKYGALSNETGQVAVTWSIEGAKPGALKLVWSESGGPPVGKPEHKGFGSRSIERNLAHDLDGQARINYRADGVVCTITSPLQPAGGKG